MNVTHHIQALSDQINADDLIGGPIVAQIVAVKVAERKVAKGEQPVSLGLSGGHMAFRPCKTMLRVLVAAWGPDASQWQGRWLRLYRDPSIRFGGDQVGGVRISAMSDIAEPLSLALTATRGKKTLHRVDVLRAPQQQGAPTADLDALLAQHGLTRADVDAWLGASNKPTLDAAPDRVPGLASWLAADLSRLDQIRPTTTEQE